jgi:hypothetical protein
VPAGSVTRKAWLCAKPAIVALPVGHRA